MNIELIEIAGIRALVEAVRLPWESHDRSDSHLKFNLDCKEVFGDLQITYGVNGTFGEDDISLAERLAKAGDDHGKAIRGVVVYLKITAPRYMWPEIDTYTVGVTPMGSDSTMHKEGKHLKGAELQKVKSEIKEGRLQTRIKMFSYPTLSRIKRQRKNHRLPEWQEFIDFINTLPFQELLI